MTSVPHASNDASQDKVGQRPPVGTNPPTRFSLSLIGSRALDVLAYLFTIGELGATSQDEIAAIGHISEASVSKAMLELVARGFITRVWDRAMNGGHGGYWITLLPHPDALGSTPDPAHEGSSADPAAESLESPVPLPDTPFTASQCEKDRELIPGRAVMDDHDSCFSSNNMRGRSEKNDWAGVTIDGADFIPWQALEKAGQTPESVRAADAVIRTRTEYDRPTQIRILFDCLLHHKPITSAADMARREEPRRERSAERHGGTGQADSRRDRPRRADRSEDSQRPRAAATRFSRESYRGCAHD